MNNSKVQWIHDRKSKRNLKTVTQTQTHIPGSEQGLRMKQFQYHFGSTTKGR